MKVTNRNCDTVIELVVIMSLIVWLASITAYVNGHELHGVYGGLAATIGLLLAKALRFLVRNTGVVK